MVIDSILKARFGWQKQALKTDWFHYKIKPARLSSRGCCPINSSSQIPLISHKSCLPPLNQVEYY